MFPPSFLPSMCQRNRRHFSLSLSCDFFFHFYWCLGYLWLGAWGSSPSIKTLLNRSGDSSSSQPRVPIWNLYPEWLFWIVGVPEKYSSTHPSSHPFWSVFYQLPSFRNYGNALPNPWEWYPCNIDEISTKINYEIIEGNTCSS